MTEPLNEQLSALLDGELAPEETELLMKRLARDATLRATLGRYALCGEALRASAPFNRPRADLASRISAAITAGEPAPVAPPAPVRRPASRVVTWLRPVGGLAVAAAVAALAVLVLGRPPEQPGIPVAQNVIQMPTNVDPNPTATTAMSLGAGGSEPASYTTPSARRPIVAAMPTAELATYLVAHAQHSSLITRRTVMSDVIASTPPAPPVAAPAPAPLP